MLLAVAFFFTACEDDEKPKTVPAVTTGAVTGVTATSAVVSGEIPDDGNAEITERGFVYSSVVTEPTVADDKVGLTDAEGSFSTSLEGLSSGTTYYIRAYATNSVGTGYGEVKDFTTDNAAPIASNVAFTGELEVNKELTGTYTYSDSEGDAETGTIYQWYMANDAAGTGATVIPGATATTFTIKDEQQGKYIAFGVIPKAATGSAGGTEVRSLFLGAIGEAKTVTFTYNGQEVTYGIITSTVTGKKWLDRNLGAVNIPTAYNDYANYGDLFQWGRGPDGHQVVSRIGPTDTDASGSVVTSTTEPYELSSTTSPGHSKWIIVGASPFDWKSPQNNDLWQGVSGINNPCPSGWRIATLAEWAAENLGTISEAFTKLNITLTGGRSGGNGSFFQTSGRGQYWASDIDTSFGYSLSGRTYIDTSGTTQGSSGSHATGMACRCIKD